MSLRARLGDLRRTVHRSFHVRPSLLSNPVPIVSFCFDDFPKTALSVGGTILTRANARATYYAALGLMNTTNELGEQLTESDIKALLYDGHELGGHTFGHSSSRKVPLDVFEKDACNGRDAIRQLTGCDASNFAYPYGHVTLGTKKRLGKEMTSCRGTDDGVNGPIVDLNLLRANSLYGDIDQFIRAESLLKSTQDQSGWVIFYTHDVRPSPSSYGCTPALFEAVLRRSLDMGFQVKTIGEVVDRAQPITRGTV